MIKQMHQRNVLFVIIGIFLNKKFKFQPYVCNGCHDVLIMPVNPNDIAICGVHYQIKS